MQKIKFILCFFLGLLVHNHSIQAQQNRHFEFTLSSPQFTQGVSNLAVNIQFPNIPIWGWLEVTITSTYSHQLATGKLTKRYEIGHNIGSPGFFNQTTEISEAFGEVATQWYIGDFNHDSNSIPIYHLVSTANILTIKIEGVLANLDADIDLLKTNTTISPLTTASSPGTRQYMSIMQDRVGIGTNTPDAKLAVNGTIHSKEVKVDMNGWSDFVFKKEYNLPTLEEVEKHIIEKGHLENIPSEKEVLKDGISLGEMNAKLLQKIEELTLYMIEMKKDITLLKEENKVLKSKKKRKDNFITDK